MSNGTLAFCGLAGGLAATSIINILFGTSNAYLWFCMLWGTNGLLQVDHCELIVPLGAVGIIRLKAFRVAPARSFDYLILTSLHSFFISSSIHCTVKILFVSNGLILKVANTPGGVSNLNSTSNFLNSIKNDILIAQI